MSEKTKNRWYRTVSVALALILLVNAIALPISAIGSQISLRTVSSNEVASAKEGSLADITLPNYSTNPNTPEYNGQVLPVYTTGIYNYLRNYSSVFTSYGRFSSRTEKRSQYYTGSILTLGNINERYMNETTSTLPYTEERSLMLHPELAVYGTDGNSLAGTLYSDDFKYATYSGDSIWNYLDPEQVQVKFSGTVISGNGRLVVYYYGDDYSYQKYADEFTYNVNDKGYKTTLKQLAAGETYNLSVTVPITTEDYEFSVHYMPWDENSIITDPHAALIDDAAPYIKDVQFDIEKRSADDGADLVMKVTFNEGIRYLSDYNLEEEFAKTYIVARVWDATNAKNHDVKLYLDSVDGSRDVVFRADIGKLHYCDLSLKYLSMRYSNIKKATHRTVESGFIDLVDGMVLGVGRVKEYGNKNISAVKTYLTNGVTPVTILADHAGNAVDFSSLWNWDVSSFKFYSDTFEADKVEIYNDKTLGVELGSIDGSLASTSDVYVGPERDMTVYVWTDKVLPEEAWKQVYITLNIRDSEGNALKVYPTNASQYTDDEVYANGSKTGMLLKYENIPITSDMTVDAKEGEAPQVRVASMGTDYKRENTGYPTAYPYVKDPVTAMYFDTTPPTVEVRKTVERTDEDENGKYYKVSVEISVSDENGEYISGLVGMPMFISMGGGVEKETDIKYLLSTDAAPPEDIGEYTEETVLYENAMVTVGGIGFINNSEKIYLHILAPSGSIYLKDLKLNVSVSDAVGNSTDKEEAKTVDYIIDEIAPTVNIDSKRAVAGENNSTVNLTVNISAKDHTRVDRLLYYFGGSTLEGDEDWQVAKIGEFGSRVSASVQREYGDPDSQNPDVNRIYSETLWVKSVDMYGNESQPVGTYIRLSLEKPTTSVKYSADPNAINRGGELLVSGPEASSFDGSDAYTRVSLTPIGNQEYSYVTLVKTGENDVDILSLSGLVWYRVRIESGEYTEVSSPIDLTDTYSGDILDGLLNCYGEIKISFENGYGDMTPATGSVSAMANAGSYMSDPSYYTLRYSSPLNSNTDIHYVDFGSIIDYAIPTGSDATVIQIGGSVVVEDADEGAAVYVFNQKYKGVNPMRNAQIHYSISNIANSSYGLLDIDFAASYAELIKVGEDGKADETVALQSGLWSTQNQYFTVNSLTDSGEAFKTGAYYLKVTVVSGGGCKNSYESSRIVLDAQNADNAGLWEYSYGSVENITALDDTRYAEIKKSAEDKAFDSIGISVISGGGETSRDRMFATYSYGVDGLTLVLSVPNTARTVEGVEVGTVEGFKIWNLLSAPTEAEISARRFELTDGSDTLVREVSTRSIYTSDTIPTGISGMSKLFLVKGTNTICYQVKLSNGYVSPIRQFNITVTDEVPKLSVSIEGYQPSITPSQTDGVINADHIRYYIDTAYSVNGSGDVNVNLWSTYNMNLGLLDGEGNINEVFTASTQSSLKVLYEGMKVDEYADFTKNTYTANFPYDSMVWCTAVFVATDDYGGVAIVAPQIGDIERINVDAGSVGNAHEIDIEYYGGYFDDPYDLAYSPYKWRVLYNQVQYFGAQVLGFETYLVENTQDGEIRTEDIQSAEADLRYNLFNISTNDISMADGVAYDNGTHVKVGFEEYLNKNYILLSDATVTLSGGYIGEEPLTLDFLDGDVITVNGNGEAEVALGQGNTVGYMHGHLGEQLEFYLANPMATEENPKGTTVDINYTLRYSNIYGDVYEHTGTVTMTYIEYKISGSKMTESGAKLTFGFEAKDLYNSGVERTGVFTSGTYKVTVPDYFGNSLEYQYTVSSQADLNTRVNYANFKNTANYVTVTLIGNYDIYVDVTDYAVMSVENNGTDNVTVRVYENTRFSYRYDDLMGYISTYYVNVDNIYNPSPDVVWDYDKESYNVAEDGTKYRYGSVTVYLTDKNFTLTDKYTGQMPTFTFLPGADNSYTFKKEDIVARLGDEEVELDSDITVTLDVVLYEVPSVQFSDEDDSETPNVLVKAYSKLNEAYSDTKMLMALTNTRNSEVFPSAYGYEVYEYVGNRANMSEILDRMGWSTAYRFTLETVDSNKVRLFIKEGLYADAPDYESGKSDIIEGVTLNSKLLSVTKNAKFTLFVVDVADNYSSVAFDIKNISEAPVPTVTKIPISHGEVRLYIIAPEGVNEEDLRILSPEYKVDTDTESEYYLKKYIEISANDNYDIIYEIKYNGVTVTDTLSAVSVTEISLDEIAMQGLVWSQNKASEATANEVTVDIKFSHNVSEIRALESYEASKVKFEIAGNSVRVIYSDNHRAISFAAIADNSTFVTVNLDSVTNIDKSAPNISLVSEELSANGKSLLLTLSSDERAGLKELNGAIGEAVADSLGNTLYYYTVRITENREYSFTFADMSGVMTTYIYKTDALVLDELTVLYNTAPSSDGAVPDPYLLSLKTGDKVYIKPARDVSATLTGMSALIEIESVDWYELTIPEASGGIPPYIVYTDEFGNTLTHQFSLVELPDSTPPEIIINKTTYAVRVGTDREEIEKALLANALVFDDKDGDINLSVEFTSDIDVIGLSEVKYIATDSSDNKATSYGKLRITSIYEPIIYVDGERVLRDEGVHLKAGEEIKLNIDTMGVAYKAVLANGILTSAQMKDIESISGYTSESELNLGALESGVYTVLIITEQREYFRILLSVENF